MWSTFMLKKHRDLLSLNSQLRACKCFMNVCQMALSHDKNIYEEATKLFPIVCSLDNTFCVSNYINLKYNLTSTLYEPNTKMRLLRQLRNFSNIMQK